MASRVGDSRECVLMFCAYCIAAGADPGGSLGSRDPPPEIYQGSQKNDVLV